MSDIDLWSIPSPAERVREAMRRGMLLRNKWREKASDGRELACLLGWISREAGEKERASACPAHVMPTWLAALTPWLDDAPSEAAWPRVIARYADLLERSGALFANPAACERLDYRVRAICVRAARDHVDAQSTQVREAIDGVLTLLDRAATGDVAPDQEWMVAERAAARAANVADAAAKAADATAAAGAAGAAMPRMALAAVTAADAAADRAVEDRLVAAILDAWEHAIAQENVR